jgi:hypothetical protein
MMMKTTNIKTKYITTVNILYGHMPRNSFVHINMLPIIKRHGELVVISHI